MIVPLDKFLFSNNLCIATIGSISIFPIFKNGSSSIIKFCQENNHKVIDIEQAGKLDELIVFIRNPAERFESGIRTVVYNTLRDNPDSNLDAATVSFMLQKYLFLDVHFIPQFHWLLNLSRYIGKNVKLKLLPMGALDNFVHNMHKEILQNKHIKIDTDNFQNLYLQLDTILFNQIGNTLTFNEILSLIKNDADAGFSELVDLPTEIIELLK